MWNRVFIRNKNKCKTYGLNGFKIARKNHDEDKIVSKQINLIFKSFLNKIISMNYIKFKIVIDIQMAFLISILYAQ